MYTKFIQRLKEYLVPPVVERRGPRLNFQIVDDPDPHVTQLERFMTMLAFIVPVFTLPQVFQIFYHQDAAGINTLTWSIYVLVSAVFLGYGIAKQQKPLIVMYSLSIVTYTLILIGSLLY